VESTRERRTARLLLRPIRESDLTVLESIHVDPRTNTYSADGPPSRERVQSMLASFIAAWEGSGHSYWSVELEGTVVGAAGVEARAILGRRCWNLYYRFDADVRGRGLATEAATEAVAVARALDAARPVVARTRPENERAARLAERAGLVRRPDLDHDGYTVLATFW
jgi:RimJ/RimL family protein N-acetyltransferase